MRDASLLRAAILMAALVLASGCGQTGELYLPEDDAPAPLPEEERERPDERE